MTKKKLAQSSARNTVMQILTSFDAEVKPSKLLEDTAAMYTEFQQTTGAKQKKLAETLNVKLEHASAIYALDNHYMMAETLNKDKYRTMMIEIADQLIAQYDCKTTSEKMLAQTASWAFCHMVENSAKMSNILRMGETSHEKNGFYTMLSKEVDRNARQYFSALSTLSHFKQPAMQVVFKANNAFVATNQQINSTDKKPREQTNVGQ